VGDFDTAHFLTTRKVLSTLLRILLFFGHAWTRKEEARNAHWELFTASGKVVTQEPVPPNFRSLFRIFLSKNVKSKMVTGTFRASGQREQKAQTRGIYRFGQV
jgi:hypothetical protein